MSYRCWFWQIEIDASGMIISIQIDCMSLLIVGSCSRITQNIIHALSRQQLYQKITIADLIPTYDFHRRFYKLKRSLHDEKLTTDLAINKITLAEELYKSINSHQDVLYVTHDYFQSVTSKTQLMELTAELSKKKEHVLFATPVEYDHFGFQNPGHTYLNSQTKVLQQNPSAGFIRSDLQDASEFYAYLHKTKGFLQERLISVPESFRPHVLSSGFYADQIVQALKAKTKGEVTVLKGDSQKSVKEVAQNRDIEDFEIQHHKQNIRGLVKKYKGVEQSKAAKATQ